jgi:hypothetical protein
MRKTPHALLIAFCLLIGIAVAAQQPTKPKTKTPANKTKTKTNPNRDNTTMDTTSTMMQDTTSMQGGGGGMDAAAPYTASYSSQFTIGNAAYARQVLNLWKDYDNNMLDRSAAMFADTVSFVGDDGMSIRGKDSVMNAIKQLRSQFTTVKSSVDAYMPLRSTDRNEDWVAIWGREEDTNASGTTTTMIIHEIWRFNRDGKIDFVRQFTARPPVQ